jgi:oxygen-independent coproporphyrinogen-3 oxidase
MDYGVYFHIPFCKRRCHYCDFNTYAGMESYITDYMQALKKEIRVVIDKKNNTSVKTIYFGGGTPSLVPAFLYSQLFDEIRHTFVIANDCEITLEANPGTLSLAYLKELKEIGVNRLSLGVQSTDSFDLQRLDRIHSVEDVLENYRNARRVGFKNINLDLIFGLPWQDLPSWKNSLDRAIALQPDHFSLYALIIEPGTPLFAWHQKGWIEPQDEDLEADMYEYAMDALARAGYEHYEISNWAKRSIGHSFQSRHNKQYWLNQPYFGFGAGAHGYVNHTRTVNTPRIQDYLDRMLRPSPENLVFPLSPASISSEKTDTTTQMLDSMMLGLRLVQDGVSEGLFAARFQRSMRDVFGDKIGKLEQQGLVEWMGDTDQRLLLTHRGIFLANRVFREFV